MRCPECKSKDVDEIDGEPGVYFCNDCGHEWDEGKDDEEEVWDEND